MERRLAAVLVADVVGYSRLMNEDEEGTLRAVKDTFKSLINPKVAQYRGRIIKLTGDGALMEFASAVDAVAFAVEVQCAMRERNHDVPEERRIEYRVGINIGDIIIEGDDIFGDGVNIAARLEGLAEPGGICVARNVFNQVKGKLDLTFKLLGKRKVKNIAEPVPVYQLLLNDKAEQLVTEVQAGASVRAPWHSYAAAAFVLLFIAGSIIWWQPWAPKVVGPAPVDPAHVEQASLPLPDKPSIVVLPFNNISADPTQEYFVDGMTEDLTTDLSRVPGLFVIARNSAFTYKDKAVKVRDVSHELGVRYVLEGSVRKMGGRLRINTQLIDATTGGHIWAERYDRKLQDVFALQDEVVGKIVSALQVQLTASEKRGLGRQHANSVKAYELYLLGRREFVRRSKDGNSKARTLFEKAIDLDPRFARGYAYLSWAHTRDFIDGWSTKPANSLDQARNLVSKAIDLDDTLPLAQLVMGLVALYTKEHEKALVALEKAVALDHNYSDAYALTTRILNLAGRPEAGLEPMKMAMRLNPHQPQAYFFILGTAYFGLGRYADAVNALKEALARNPTAQRPRMWLVAAFSKLGQIEDAKWEAEELLTLDPDFSLKRISQVLPFKSREHLEVLLDGLRNAELPE